MNTFFLAIPQLCWVLSDRNPFLFIKNLIFFWFVLIAAEVFKLDLILPVTLINQRTKFSFGLKSKSDIAVLKEIFLKKEYEWLEINNPEIIIDLGAHIGDTALYYHTLYPEAKIIAVEPDPNLFNRLVINVSKIKNIVPVNAGVTGQTGFGVLNISKRSSLSGSVIKRSKTDNTVAINTLSLDDLLLQNNIVKADLIKFDIEGAEKSMFGDSSALKYANAYIGELHCDLANFEPNDFLKHFSGFRVNLQPMGRIKRFKFQAIKNED